MVLGGVEEDWNEQVWLPLGGRSGWKGIEEFSIARARTPGNCGIGRENSVDPGWSGVLNPIFGLQFIFHFFFFFFF